MTGAFGQLGAELCAQDDVSAKYKCSKCGRIYLRDSSKNWIKSYCSLYECSARLMRCVKVRRVK